MKIAIDIRHLAAENQAGVGRYTIEVIKRMVEAAPDDHFFLFAAGTKKTLDHLPTFNAPNVSVLPLPIPNRFLFLIFFLRLRTIESFFPERPDILWLPNHNIVHTQLPYILTVHDLSFDIFPEFFTWKDRLRYRIGRAKQQTQSAQHLLAVSESTKRDLQERWGIDTDHITVTPLAAGEEYHAKELPSDKSYLAAHDVKKPYILCLCTREPRKNLEAVVEAYKIWISNLPPTPNPLPPELIIAGGRGWKSKSLHRLIEQKKCTSLVKILDYIPNKHKPALYRHAKTFLFPSFYEGFGLPALEAAACGTPVIASFNGSLPEVLDAYAIFVDPYNVTDLVAAFEQVHTKKAQTLRTSTWNKTATETLNTLRSSPTSDSVM